MTQMRKRVEKLEARMPEQARRGVWRDAEQTDAEALAVARCGAADNVLIVSWRE